MPKIFHRPTPGSLIAIGGYHSSQKLLVLVLSVERNEFSKNYFVDVLGPDGQRATMSAQRAPDEWFWGKRCKQRRISFLGDSGKGWPNGFRNYSEHWDEVS